MKILFIGDVHAKFGYLMSLVNGSDADVVIQCGDFGIWTDAVKGLGLPAQYHVNFNKPVYFVEGNHDNHAWLAWAKENMPRSSYGGVALTDNIIWMPRGHRCEIGGKKFLFCGGADSVDKAYRLQWYPETWWPGEVIGESVLDSVGDGEEFDFVVTHDRPSLVTQYLDHGVLPGKSAQVLDRLSEKVRAKEWFHGHWHLREEAVLNGTHYVGLDMLRLQGSEDAMQLVEI